MRRVAVLIAAAAIDLAGEPPNRLHPVVAMGTILGRLDPWIRRGGPVRQFSAGLAVALAGPAAAYIAGRSIERLVGRWPVLLIGEAWLLKTCLAWRTLDRAAGRVEAALVADDLGAARAGLRWLVSRDPASLDAGQVAAAAIESVAENASDSLVGPTLAYARFGLGGALAYRWINTSDAMYGYRGDREWSGKAAARLDDLVNLVPARLTALLILLSWPAAARTAWRDAGATASPNAGWPMAAMAEVLDRRLEKVGHYVLNDAALSPNAADIGQARAVVRRGWLAWITVLVLAGVPRIGTQPRGIRNPRVGWAIDTCVSLLPAHRARLPGASKVVRWAAPLAGTDALPTRSLWPGTANLW